MNFAAEHIGVAARDTAAMKDWYVRVLGAELVFRMPQEPPAFLVRLGAILIEFYPANDSTDATRNNRLAGWRHLALRVEQLEVARDLLASRGVLFPDPIKPAGGGGRVLFFSDPEGNLVHLVERLPGGYQ